MRHDHAGESDEVSDARALPRRGLIAGAGATVLAGAVLGLQGRAAAAPHDEPSGQASALSEPLASPIASTIASAPLTGYAYRVASMFDFSPEFSSSQRAWGGYGVYAAGSGGPLWASIDVPAGALVRDIEWYVRNGSGGPVGGLGRLWAAGVGDLFTTLADASIAVGTSITATRVTVPSAAYGPYPTATKVNLGISTLASGAIQVNGVRVGMTNGGATNGLLDTPVRIYDSRSGARFSAGSTRTLTVPASIAPAGVSGILANVIAVSATANGYLRVFRATSPLPAASAVNFTVAGGSIANAQPIGISTARQFKVYASAPVHVVIDVVGIIA